MKLIIYINGRPNVHGHKRREFLWNPTHNCHVYRNTEYTPAEFNAVIEKAMSQNQDMFPMVRVVGFAETVSAPPPIDLTGRAKELESVVASLREQIASPIEEAPAMEPIATITAAREITLDEAIAVVSRQAPNFLKKGVLKRATA